jgi:hypothetical protein
LWVALSRGIGAIREARPPPTVADQVTPPSRTSPVDELTRLAALLNDGLLTREEFDRLKARLIAGP